MFNTYCYLSITNSTIEEIISFVNYTKSSDILQEFKKIVIHLDKNLTQENFDKIKGKIEGIDNENLSNYWVHPGQNNYLNLKYCEEMYVNTHVFKE